MHPRLYNYLSLDHIKQIASNLENSSRPAITKESNLTTKLNVGFYASMKTLERPTSKMEEIINIVERRNVSLKNIVQAILKLEKTVNVAT